MQGSFVLLYFRLFTFSITRTVLFVGISQVIGCEDRLQNDLRCVNWGAIGALNFTPKSKVCH